MSQIFRNVGQLFNEEKLASVSSTPEWSSEVIEPVRIELEELLEKREPLFEEILESKDGFTSLKNQYYWVSYVFRVLGLSFSVAEQLPNPDGSGLRPDFTLFYSADEFRSAKSHRGEREFYAQVLAVAKVLDWNASLDEYPEGHDGPQNPAYDLDRLIRGTGINWGILTNGVLWRLYQRETSGLFNTYYEVDLMAALEAPDVDAFKYFWAFFSPEGLGGYDGNDPLVYRFLQ